MTTVMASAPPSGETEPAFRLLREPPLERPCHPAVPLKAVALPAEHGGWGFLAEPVILGLVLAPSAAGVCLALAALAAFLARHPLRLLLLDRRKGTRYPR